MYSRQGRGVALKQHLLYKLVSVECCGGIEQQFSIYVLTLNPAPQSLDDCFWKLSFWRPPGATLTDVQNENQKDSGAEDRWHTAGEGYNCFKPIPFNFQHNANIHSCTLTVWSDPSLPSTSGSLQHQHLPESRSSAQLRSSLLLSGCVYLRKVDRGFPWMSTENVVLRLGDNKWDMHMWHDVPLFSYCC